MRAFLLTMLLLPAFAASSANAKAAEACAFYKIGGPNAEGLCLYYAFFCAPASGPATGLFACNANTSGCGMSGASCIPGLGSSNRLHTKMVHPDLENGYGTKPDGTPTAAPALSNVMFEFNAPAELPGATKETWLVTFNDKPGSAGERFARVVRVTLPAQDVNGQPMERNVSVFGWQVQRDPGLSYLPAEVIRKTRTGKNRARIAVEVSDGEAVIAEVVMHKTHGPNPIVAPPVPAPPAAPPHAKPCT